MDRRTILASLGLGGASASGLVQMPSAAKASGLQDGEAARPGALPPIIDVHAHPPMPSMLAALKRSDPQGRAMMDSQTALPDWTAEEGIALMDAHGVEVMMMSQPYQISSLPVRDPGVLARSVNDDMAAVIARHPRRYGAFAMLPLHDIDASLKEMARALDELKFDGVCLLTNIDGAYLGDGRFEPLFAELNRRRTVAFVHPTAPAYLAHLALPFDPSIMEFMMDSARAAASLILSGRRKAYPDFTYISTHGGGTIPYLIRRFETGRMITSAYGVPMTAEEIRRGFQSLHYEMTASTDRGHMASMLELVAPSRLMLGFDYPIRPTRYIEPSRAELAGSRFLGKADRKAICRGTALGLLPQLARRLAA